MQTKEASGNDCVYFQIKIIYNINMKIKLFKKDIKLPTKSHLPDVGMDCFMPQDIIIRPFETKIFNLGFGVQIPEGYGGMFVPRSSISTQGLIIQTAVIDPDYTGELHGIITNCSGSTVILKKDQRVMSLIIINVLNARVEIVSDFDRTERGDNGIGSTGK